MAPKPTIFWFRRDLRLSDNRALDVALTRGEGRVVAAFIVDPTFCAPAGATRVAYLRASLAALDESLGGRLVVRVGDPGAALASLAAETGASQVVATGDFAPAGVERDRRAREVLAGAGYSITFVDSPYVVAPGTVTSKSGAPCRVFGAFRRAWANEGWPEPLAPPVGAHYLEAESASLDELTRLSSTSRPGYFADLPDAPALHPPAAGEVGARDVLAQFTTRVEAYDDARDRPGRDGTSRLSPFLRFGALHPRQVLAATAGLSSSRQRYESEICWREFYADVMFHHPESVRRDLQGALAHLRVDRDAGARARFRAWALGETGYPLVDAGMRQLLAEGWMHNRARMVCASFLVKHLHLDWRWGARWFMWRLLDGDVASNQHGWQWVAGTGTDAAPYHRIFNPTLQAQRFDPEGRYVRRYVRELADVAAPACLEPSGGSLVNATYTPPIVDVATERREALARFAEARQRARDAS